MLVKTTSKQGSFYNVLETQGSILGVKQPPVIVQDAS